MSLIGKLLDVTDMLDGRIYRQPYRHQYLTNTKSDLEIFSTMNLALHFLHICRLDFYLKKKLLPSNFEKVLSNDKFLKVFLVEIIFYESQDGICFL
jgi:hypothetical protein